MGGFIAILRDEDRLFLSKSKESSKQLKANDGAAPGTIHVQQM